MTEFGKPGVFLADNIPGKPPILFHGVHKNELDDGTALQWLQVLSRYFENKVRDVLREDHGRSH